MALVLAYHKAAVSVMGRTGNGEGKGEALTQHHDTYSRESVQCPELF